MTALKDYTITEIEALTESEVQALAVEELTIKGFTVYFAYLGGYFGYSCLVFKNGHHIHYANDYELHHKGNRYAGTADPTREELRELYICGRNNILFTEEEIAAPLTDYSEYTRKDYFLRNYYSMQAERLSIFGNFSTEEAVEAYRERQKKFPYYSDIGFSYYADEDFVRHLEELHGKLEQAKEAMADNFEYQKDAFKREMANHEYHINWQADFDTLGAFGNIRWHGDDGEALQKYFDELQFSDLQRRAYLQARREYMREVLKEE